jgi:hypothetical protein
MQAATAGCKRQTIIGLLNTNRFFEAPMEAEHINSINTRLADLSQRVVELRRYL